MEYRFGVVLSVGDDIESDLSQSRAKQFSLAAAAFNQ